MEGDELDNIVESDDSSTALFVDCDRVNEEEKKIISTEFFQLNHFAKSNHHYILE